MTYNIDEQFMWGDTLLISPILKKGATSLNQYLPMEEKWYDFYTGESVKSGWRNETNLDRIGLHVAAGRVIPMLPGNVKHTTEQRSKPFSLLVTTSTTGNSRGELFWDDGDSLSKYKYTFLNFTEQNFRYCSLFLFLQIP